MKRVQMIIIIISILIIIPIISGYEIKEYGDIEDYFYQPNTLGAEKVHRIHELYGSSEIIDLDIIDIMFYFNESNGKHVPVIIEHPTLTINGELFRRGGGHSSWTSFAVGHNHLTANILDARESIIYFPLILNSNDKVFVGSIRLEINDDESNLGSFSVYGQIIEDNSGDIEDIQSFNQDIAEEINQIYGVLYPLQSLTTQHTIEINLCKDDISSLRSTLQSFEISLENLDDRIDALENQQPQSYNLSEGTNYWKYLDSRTKESIACGFGEDNELTLFKMDDLSVSCNMEYQRGKARCDCQEIIGTCELESPLYCYAWELRRDNLQLELVNQADDEIEIERIEIEGCEVEDRNPSIRSGQDRRYGLDCTEDFEGGQIVIEYRIDDSQIMESLGRIILSE